MVDVLCELRCLPFFPPLLSSIIHVFFTFCRNGIRNFADMSTIVEVSEDLQRLLGDGGLKPATLTRKRFYDEVYIFFLCCL